MPKAERNPKYAATHAGHLGTRAIATPDVIEAPEAQLLLESTAMTSSRRDSNAQGAKPVGFLGTDGKTSHCIPDTLGFSLPEEMAEMTIDERNQVELESAAFRRLVDHLRERTDVQNIDLMELAGFCRNCLSRWYQEAAESKGLALDKAAARQIVYGMPYDEWKEKYQTEATPEQKAAFDKQQK